VYNTVCPNVSFYKQIGDFFLKTFLLTIVLMLSVTLAYAQTNQNYHSRGNQNQKFEIRGGYNGWGYQPGVTYDPRTGWARTSGPQGGFNFRPSSGLTTFPLPTVSRRPGQYPIVQPRVNYNLGRPYIVPQGNFRPEPRNGWYNENFNREPNE
jgi:hypothetical protein